MNNDKRIFALVSLGLLLAALLVPFIIAAQGREDLAIGFGAVAGLLALLFGALSWSDRIGRTMTIASLLVLVFGVGGSAVIYMKQSAEHDASVKSATVEEAPQR
jgi:hypothetical protein